MTWLSVIPDLVSALHMIGPGPAALIGLALLVLVVSQVRAELRDPTASPAHARALALRERARHTEQLRLRDPDAAGQARPRAPTFGNAAA